MATSADCQLEERFVRLHSLVLSSTRVLKAKFDASFPPDQLKKWSPKDNDLKNAKLSAYQIKHLKANRDSSKFDISLLVSLLRNFCYKNDKTHPLWDELDNDNIVPSLQCEIAQIVRIRNLRNKMSHAPVAEMNESDFNKHWNVVSNAIQRLGHTCGWTNLRDLVEELRTNPVNSFTPRMKTLRESTLQFLKHKADVHYVKTTQYENARKVLLDKHLLVLTGHPGEGKTTMAANLALEDGAKRENCVKLECVSDWKDVDWSLRCFTTVIIDDIFGGRSLDHELLKDWKSVLNDIELFAKDKYLKVIITSRQYITKEAREMLDNITMFDETSDNNIHLESSSLSSDEMKCILKAVLERSGTEENMEKLGIDLDDCVKKTKGLYNRLLGQRSGTVFGFPECAVLFASGSLMEHHGSKFFESPESHFKCFEQLYKSRDTEQFYKFLSLVIIWSEKTQTIKVEDLQNPLKASAHVRQIADCFGVKMDHFFIETLKLSLDAYSKFLLLDINKTGQYTFTHNVIGEMVGVVLGEHRPRECLQLCQRDFLMHRITVDKSDQDRLKVSVPPCLESELIQRFAQMICRDGCNSTKVKSESSNIDAAIFKHEAFKSDAFAKAFGVQKINKKLARKLFQFSVEADGKRKIYLVEFLLENNLFTLAEQIVLHMEQSFGNRKYVSVRAICMVMLNHPSLFETLFRFNRADVNLVFYLKKQDLLTNKNGTTLLIEAARNNVDTAVSFLLKHRAKVNVKTGLTPVHAAASEGHHKIVEVLLQNGAKKNATTDIYETPLHTAANVGHHKVVNILLQYGAAINARANDNWTPLHKAASGGHHTVVEILLQHLAEINARANDNWTPLHKAAEGGHHTVVEILLQYGAAINARANDNWTPLHKAAEGGHHTVVEILLQHGAEINARANENWTPLHKAAWGGHHTVVEILLQHGAEITARTDMIDMNETPLHKAASGGHHTVVEILLQHKADINEKTKANLTPLHKAARGGHHTVVEVLLQHGAKINAQTFWYETPLHLAAEGGHHTVVEILLQHGAVIDAWVVEILRTATRNRDKCLNKQK